MQGARAGHFFSTPLPRNPFSRKKNVRSIERINLIKGGVLIFVDIIASAFIFCGFKKRGVKIPESSKD